MGDIANIAESRRTVQLFLREDAPDEINHEGSASPLALKAKAASLFEKSTRLMCMQFIPYHYIHGIILT